MKPNGDKKILREQVEFFIDKGFSPNKDIDENEVFLDDVLMEVPNKINNLYIDRNISFIKSVVFSLKENGMGIKGASKVITTTIKSLFDYKPDVNPVNYE